MGPRALETLDISRGIHKLCSDLKKCSQMIFEFLIPELALLIQAVVKCFLTTHYCLSLQKITDDTYNDKSHIFKVNLM